MASVSGQFFLKAGALRLGRATPSNAVSHILSIATTPELIAGLACYGLGAMAYILLLTRVKLSIAGPSIALVYIFTVLMGYFFFKEAIPPTRIVGLGFIIGGVLLVMWQR
ncbi:MAG: EamA family transporter [Oculatellaceae cyanobacterium bins.114]|nr:EamA family transporter [Oculatellaceae cyanobacterium bins.114]